MYNTDVKIIRHIYCDLLPQLMKKFQFTDEEIFTLTNARTIMIKKAQEIENAKTE